jgi:hypothetical protein
MVNLLSKPPFIVSTGDNVYSPVEMLEIHLGRFLPRKREIPQMVNDIVGVNCMIPDFDQLIIHLGCRGKRALTVLDHVVMTKMCICSEPGRHNYPLSNPNYV